MSVNECNMVNNLINKAIEIFSIKGYEATHLTDITNALNISRGPIYYHFKDKYGLYYAAYQQYEKEVRNLQHKIIAEKKPIPKLLEDIIYEFIKYSKRFGTSFLFGVDTLAELSSIKALNDKLNCDLYHEKLELVERLLQKGEIKEGIDPKVTVDMVYIVYMGIINAIQLEMIDDYTEEDIRKMISVLLAGIRQYCI